MSASGGFIDKYGIRARTRLNTGITGAVFDEAANCWRLATSTGDTLTARYVIGATGVLTQPKKPEIPGIDSFAGVTMHTARWNHDVDLRGKRVAIIGTGASALQVIPEIAPQVAHLTVFQRTPIWVLPKPDAVIPGAVKTLMKKLPWVQVPARLASQAFVETTFVLAAHYYRQLRIVKAFEPIALKHLERQVKDPVTRAKLTPRYGLGCKRPSVSNTYLKTFNRDNVALVTEGITEVVPEGVRTADGHLHEIDVLICATGFKVFESGNMPPFRVTGAGGRDLEAWWDEHRYQAYEGVSMPGFPNFFLILGPNGYNGASYFQLIEQQVRHIGRCLKQARKRGATRLEAHWRSFTFPLSDYRFS